MATASTPIAAKPDSIRPHWRTSALAAATSWPRRAKDLVVERRHDEERVGPARDDDQRAEHPAHVVRLEIGDEPGDRRDERESREERHAAAVARRPFAEQRLLVEREPRRLLDPVDIDCRPGECGGEGQGEIPET